jgi:hypothetical protein
MHRRQTTSVIAGAAGALLAVVGFAGCSGEDVTESLVERSIEAGQGGDVDVDLDGGQVRIETDEGVVEFEADGDGSFTLSGPEGSVVMEGNDDGFTVTDGDASFEASTSAELPDDFPADLPRPDGTLVSATRYAEADGVSYVLAYEQPDVDVIDVYEALKGRLAAAGFQPELDATSTGGVTAQWTDGTTTVSFTGASGSGFGNWQYVVAPAAP